MRPSSLKLQAVKIPFWLRATLLAVMGAFLIMIVAPGCGRSSLEPESLDSGTSSSCGPSNCPTGCCDSTGTCRTGRDVRACGSTGGRCSDCVANGFSLCTSSRVCGRDDPSCSPSTCSGCCATDEGRRRCLSGTEPSACGKTGAQCSDCASQGRACDASTRACGSTKCDASNCDGCCVGDKCLPGDVASACGTKGAQCDSCASGQLCRTQAGGGGICEGTSTCGPANCGGCCNAAGQCVTGNDTTACGKQGEKCAACGANQICIPDGQPNARTCQAQTTCGPTNCPGCCVGNQCVVNGTPQACGTNGKQCIKCGTNETCSNGTCVGTGDCNPVTCAGCCVGDICAVGTQNTACGVGGGLCENCNNKVPQRVCQTGVCELPNCGPLTCPNGCCSGNTCVVGTQDNACGATGGGACLDCTSTNQICQNRQCRDKCGPANCSGCCQANNTCATGIANNACGSGGIACSNCNVGNSFCNGLVVPRRCNNQQNTCPAPYPQCPGGTTTPQTPALQSVCTDADLDLIATACALGPDTGTCAATVAAAPAGCQTCLKPFNKPFEDNAGLYACAASFVDANCRRATGCELDCSNTSCTQCLPSSTDQCQALVNSNGGQCRTFFQAANQCTTNALQAGQLCSQFSYANYGQWLRGVGDHFCGNGP